MRLIDAILDRFSMYRFLLYYLLFLLAAAVGLSLFGFLHDNPLAIIFSASYLVAVGWVTNKLFAYVFGAPANPESTLITALILSLIITPLTTPGSLIFLTAAPIVAIASKYILAIHNKQLFNPAAIAVVLTAFGAGQAASWWVGSAPLLPFVVVGGLLLLRKIRRFTMASIFIATAYATTTGYALLSGGNLVTTLTRLTLNSALFFLAFIMLTEPFTSPRSTPKQRWYALLAGFLFPPQVHLFGLYSTPELALVISNTFSYIIDPPVKALLALTQKLRRSPDMYDFILQPDKAFAYQPGQYIELALPHPHTDSRGNRRYFTLASSPTEPELRLGVKFYPNGSSYKHALLAADASSQMVATQLGGDFTLPKDHETKLAFIAGGIGITPFRSMLQYLLDTNGQRDVAMLYSASKARDFVYVDVLERAYKELGANIIYCVSREKVTRLSNRLRSGSVTAELVQKTIPDFNERVFYVSGPHTFVEHIQDELRRLGVHRHHVKIDFFPGY